MLFVMFTNISSIAIVCGSCVDMNMQPHLHRSFNFKQTGPTSILHIYLAKCCRLPYQCALYIEKAEKRTLIISVLYLVRYVFYSMWNYWKHYVFNFKCFSSSLCKLMFRWRNLCFKKWNFFAIILTLYRSRTNSWKHERLKSCR